MKTLRVIGMVPLVLLAASAFPQGAVHRGGGSGGGSSAAGARHTGGGSGGSGSHASGSGGSTASPRGNEPSGGYSSSSAETRRPRPGSGTGHRDYYGNEYRHYGYGGYPYSYYYSPYYSYWGYPGYSWGYGLGYGYPYYGYGYGYDWGGYAYAPSPYYYGGGGYGNESRRDRGIAQVRTLVEPAKTRVYVDGYYAGTADDFDGLFQRLNVSPGRHDITLKLEGYTSHVFSIFASSGQTIKLRFDMVKGAGESRETVGDDFERRLEPAPGTIEDRPYREPEPARSRPESGRESAPEPNDRPALRMSQPGSGDVLFDILPLDASVYIDGEFHGKASQVTQVQLAFGRHRVEVVRPGYRTEETEVNVDADARKVVVKLERR
jgi:hypothetical protein